MPAFRSSSAVRFGPGAFRLFLAAMVVFHHANLIALGSWAVFVFFVLSGYWVTGMWEQTYRRCRTPYLTFIVSRYWRLMPLFCVCYGLTFLLLWGAGSPEWPPLLAEHLRRPEWIARLLVIASSSRQEVPLPPAWSLDIEMQFYLVLPLLTLLVGWAASRTGWIRFAALAALLGAGVGAYFKAPVGNYALFFLAGMMISLCRWNPSRAVATASAAGVVASIAALWWMPSTHDWISGTATIPTNRAINIANDMMCAALAVLAVPFAARNVHMQTAGTLDRHLGNLAYAVYLFHYLPKIAMDLIVIPYGWPRTFVLALDFALVAVGSVCLYWWIDRPFDTWRKQWVRSRRLPAEHLGVVVGGDVMAAKAGARS